MRAVFDLDDTICVHQNRDYVNAIPKKEVISKMQEMKNDGWEIIIYSSRGQVSCNGDLQKIEQKNRKVAEDWLAKNNVPFDELIFGKPIADLYVDDKAMSVSDFEKQKFEFLHGGGSRKSIYRIGNFIKKDLGNAEETKRFREWIEDNGRICLFPKVISYLYNGVYMDYIEGEILANDCTKKDIDDVLAIVWKFKEIKKNDFSVAPQMQILEKNRSDDLDWNQYIDATERFLKANEPFISAHASYSHGDLTLGNIIKNKNGLYLIDPRYFRESSSYLFDLAKLRMSLMNYELRFGLARGDNQKYLDYFDGIMEAEGIKDVVIGLNLMYICRLYRYKTEEEKIIVKNMAREVVKGFGN